MIANLSTLGLFYYDSSLFDSLAVPYGISKDTLVDSIISQTASFCTLYPNPELFKRMLSSWSTRRLPIWQRLYDTTTLVYDPIENYNRVEEWTDNENEYTKQSNTETNTITMESSGRTDNDASSSDSSDSSVAAFNETALVPSSSENLIGTSSSSAATFANSSQNDSINRTNTATRENTITRSNHARGNIGVTTTQQMIEQERSISSFDIYQIIVDDFIDAFCVAVY